MNLVLLAVLIGIFSLYLIAVYRKLVNLMEEINIGNKDHQQIKVRLHWMRERLQKLQGLVGRNRKLAK